MNTLARSDVFRFDEARTGIPGAGGGHFITIAERASLRLLLSLPVKPNQQSPHTQDELYFVVKGRGILFHDGKRNAFGPGDAMFVAAGTEHHFEDFSDDLAVWVAFYGPQGGEA